MRCPGVETEKDEAPTRVLRHSYNGPDAQLLIRESILAPSQTFINAEKNMIRGIFVVGHDEYRTRVAEFPEMSIFVYFLPSEAGIPT